MAKGSQKTTASGSKKNSKARNSNGSANSTPSRRSATKIKSLRESPLSDDDQDSDDDDDDGSAFGEAESESVVDEEDSEESEADEGEDDGITESESDEEEVKPKGKGKAGGQKRKGSSEETVVKKAKTDKEEFDEDGRIVTELVQAPKTGHGESSRWREVELWGSRLEKEQYSHLLRASHANPMIHEFRNLT